MPRMSSPDGSEVLSIPDGGVAAMKSLGWTVEGHTGKSPKSAESAPAPAQEEEPPEDPEDEPKRRKPGRPRKHPEPE